MDVVVLKPSYPRSLHYKKKYLIGGVAAVFECKLTLKKTHIQKTLQTGSTIKRINSYVGRHTV